MFECPVPEPVSDRIQMAHVGFIDLAPEKHVRHIGDGGDGRPVVERVGLDHRVADFDGNVEHHAVDGRSDLRVAQLLVTLGDAVAHDFEVVLGVLHLLPGFSQLGLALLVLLFRDDPLVVEGTGALGLLFGLGKGDAGHVHTRFGAVERPHFRDDLHGGQHFALAHLVAGFAHHRRYDARDLGFDEHLVAGFDFARCDHVLPDGVDPGLDDGVNHLDRPGLVPQKDERPEQQRREQDAGRDLQKFFHILAVLCCSTLRVSHPPP